MEVFDKIVERSKADSEILMSMEMASFSKCQNEFCVPEVIEVDRTNNTIKLEYIGNALTLRQYYIGELKKFFQSNQKLEAIIKRMAEAISTVHKKFGIQNGIKKYNLPDKYNFSNVGYNNYLHGDFTLNNILFNLNKNQIYIIDWSTSPVFPFQANLWLQILGYIFLYFILVCHLTFYLLYECI